MGRIKCSLIKRSAQQLYEGIDVFDNNFEHNKKLLSDKMPSKSVRNKIAGQLANLAKKKNAIKKIKKPINLESQDTFKYKVGSDSRIRVLEYSTN